MPTDISERGLERLICAALSRRATRPRPNVTHRTPFSVTRQLRYLWKRVLTREGLTDILENYAQVVETKDEKTGKKSRHGAGTRRSGDRTAGGDRR